MGSDRFFLRRFTYETLINLQKSLVISGLSISSVGNCLICNFIICIISLLEVRNLKIWCKCSFFTGALDIIGWITIKWLHLTKPKFRFSPLRVGDLRWWKSLTRILAVDEAWRSLLVNNESHSLPLLNIANNRRHYHYKHVLFYKVIWGTLGHLLQIVLL